MSSDRRYRRNTTNLTAAEQHHAGDEACSSSPTELASAAVLNCRASVLRSLQGLSHRLAIRSASPSTHCYPKDTPPYGADAVAAHLGPTIQEMSAAFDELNELLVIATTAATGDAKAMYLGGGGGGSSLASRTGSVLGGGGGIRRVSGNHHHSSPTHHHHHHHHHTIKTLLDNNRTLQDQLAHHRQLADELALLMFNSQPEPSALLHEMHRQSHLDRGRSPTPPSLGVELPSSPASPSASPHRHHDNNTTHHASSSVLEYVLHNAKRLHGQLQEVFGTDKEGGPTQTNHTATSPTSPQQHSTSLSIEAFCRIAELSFTHAGESLLRQRMDAAGHGDAIDDSVRQITKGMQVELSRARQQLDDTRQDMTLMQRRHHDDILRLEERSAEALRIQETKSKKAISKLETAIKLQADSSRDRLQKIWESVQLGVAEKLSDVRGRDLQRAQVMESLRATLEDERLGSEAAFVDTDALLNEADNNHSLRGGSSSAIVTSAASGAGGAGTSSSPPSHGGGWGKGDDQLDRPRHPVYDADPHAVWTGSPTAKTVSTLQQLLKEKSTELSVILAGSSAALRSRTLRWETELRGVVSQYESLIQGQGSAAYDAHVKELEETVATLRVELTNSKAKCAALDRQLQTENTRIASVLAASTSMSSAQRKQQIGSLSPLLSSSSAAGFDGAPVISISSPHITVTPKHTQTELTGPVVSVATVEAELRTLRLSGAMSGAGGDAFVNRRASLTFAPFPVDTSYWASPPTTGGATPSASTNNLSGSFLPQAHPASILKPATTTPTSTPQQSSSIHVSSDARGVDAAEIFSDHKTNQRPITNTSPAFDSPTRINNVDSSGFQDDGAVEGSSSSRTRQPSSHSLDATPSDNSDTHDKSATLTPPNDKSATRTPPKPTAPTTPCSGAAPAISTSSSSPSDTTTTSPGKQLTRGSILTRGPGSTSATPNARGGATNKMAPPASSTSKKVPSNPSPCTSSTKKASSDVPPSRPNTTPSLRHPSNVSTGRTPLHPHPPTNIMKARGLGESADGAVGHAEGHVITTIVQEGERMPSVAEDVISRHPSTSIPRGKPPQSPPRASSDTSTLGRGAGITGSVRTTSPSPVHNESAITSASSTRVSSTSRVASGHIQQTAMGSSTNSNATANGGGRATGGDAFSREGSPVGRFVTTPTEDELVIYPPLSSSTAPAGGGAVLTDFERSRVQERQSELLRRHTIATSNNNTATHPDHVPPSSSSLIHTSRKTIQQEMEDISGRGGQPMSRSQGCSSIDDVLAEMLPRVLAPTRFYRTMCQLAATIDFAMTPPGKPSSTSNLGRLRPHVPRKLLLDATITISSLHSPHNSNNNDITGGSVVPLLSLTTSAEYLIETGVQIIRRSIMSCEGSMPCHEWDERSGDGGGVGGVVGKSTTSASPPQPPPLPHHITNLKGSLRREAATLEQMLVALVDLAEGELGVPCTLRGVLEDRCSNDPRIASSEVTKWLVSGGGGMLGGGVGAKNESTKKPQTSDATINMPASSTRPTTAPSSLMAVPVSHAQRIVNGLIATLAQLSAVTTQVDTLDTTLLKHDEATRSVPSSSSVGEAGGLVAHFLRPQVVGTAVFNPSPQQPPPMRVGGGGITSPPPPPLTISNKSIEVLVNDPARCARYIHEFVEANNARVVSSNRRSQHQQQLRQ